MKAPLIILLASFALPAHAAIFKCVNPANMKTVYQTQPCAGAVVERPIAVKRRSVAEDAAAAERLQEWHAKRAVEEAMEEQIAKERRAERLRAAEVDAARRNAVAQHEQARAQYKQAEEMSKLPVIPLIINR